ncbi:hypothetical protein DL765_010629 [Monosporascus sp. GIB2]|nr:hypothetical protein DL765_010629 [Monosporascus sp. GIB2]
MYISLELLLPVIIIPCPPQPRNFVIHNYGGTVNIGGKRGRGGGGGDGMTRRQKKQKARSDTRATASNPLGQFQAAGKGARDTSTGQSANDTSTGRSANDTDTGNGADEIEGIEEMSTGCCFGSFATYQFRPLLAKPRKWLGANPTIPLSPILPPNAPIYSEKHSSFNSREPRAISSVAQLVQRVFSIYIRGRPSRLSTATTSPRERGPQMTTSPPPQTGKKRASGLGFATRPGPPRQVARVGPIGAGGDPLAPVLNARVPCPRR